MTTDDVNALGARLRAAEADGDDKSFHEAAYEVLTAAAVEHDRADRLAARISTLTRKAEGVA